MVQKNYLDMVAWSGMAFDRVSVYIKGKIKMRSYLELEGYLLAELEIWTLDFERFGKWKANQAC
jgi:hypothetical protein